MCLKMCAVLALLPANQILQGFQEIKNRLQINSVLMPRFFTYFSSFWLTRKGPDCFSVYNEPRQTNNNVESFHSDLKHMFQVNHPNLWKMLDYLKNICIKRYITVSQLAAGLQTSKNKIYSQLQTYHKFHRIINTAAITVKEFSIQCSHSTVSYLARNSMLKQKILI